MTIEVSGETVRAWCAHIMRLRPDLMQADIAAAMGFRMKRRGDVDRGNEPPSTFSRLLSAGSKRPIGTYMRMLRAERILGVKTPWFDASGEPQAVQIPPPSPAEPRERGRDSVGRFAARRHQGEDVGELVNERLAEGGAHV